MRVAVATWSSKRVGGVEEYLNILLPALTHAGAEVALWHETREPEVRAAIELPSGTLGIFAGAGLQPALDQLREWKPDVIYVQGLANVSAEAALMKIAPAVFFLHTYVGTCISGRKTFGRPSLSPCERAFGSGCLTQYFPRRCGGRSPVTMWKLFALQSERLRLFRGYRAVLTHTEHMRREMEKHGVAARVIPYPVSWDGTAGGHARRAMDGEWRLLFAGRMEDLKGGGVLIDALPSVADAAGERRVAVTFAGDGTERAAWEARARQAAARCSNLEIEFPGWLGHEAVSGLMKRTDLLVVPSLWPEPFGSVGPSAGQHGIPAVAFASGGVSQWLEDGVTGHLAPADPPTADGLGDAIVRCLRDPAHHAELRTGARKMSLRFTMERHLPALLGQLTAA